jgi:hypothetical protein
MMHAAQILENILREAWGAIIGLMVAVAVLAMLVQILKLTGSTSLGATLFVTEAIGSIMGLVILVLYAFLALPAIVHSVSSSATSGSLCYGGHCFSSYGKSRFCFHGFRDEWSTGRYVLRDY